MATTHTPGPWKVRKTPVAHRFVIDVQGDPLLPVGLVDNQAESMDQARTSLANARLIAAAPELLAALEGMLFAADHPKVTGIGMRRIEQARAAIAKARGEG